MIRKNDPILIVGDSDEELDEVKMHLDIGYSKIYSTTDEEVATSLFEEKRPALLMLDFSTLEDAERFYLQLFHNCEHIYEIPHQTTVFVTRRELDQAYELCRREIFNDFVITRPLISEHRMRLSVAQALEKRSLRLGIQHGQILLKRLAGQIEHMRNDFQGLLQQSEGLRDKNRIGNQSLFNSIEQRLNVFRDSLMGPSMHSIVNVLDPAALTKQFEQLQRSDLQAELEQHHGKMDEALSAWTSNLESNLHLLEQAANTVREQQKQEPTILLIDDDAMQRQMLGDILEEAGYVVQTAASGAEGLGKLLHEQPALVLLDYEMPELDGMSLLKKVRATEEIKELPIIMLTGHSEKEVVRACLGAGANDYLVKPVGHERLLERVGRVLPTGKT
jgi:CheY-like chemotaxis protein